MRARARRLCMHGIRVILNRFSPAMALAAVRSGADQRKAAAAGPSRSGRQKDPPELPIVEMERKIEAASVELVKLNQMREARIKGEEAAAKARKEAEKKAQQAELEAACKAAAEAKTRFDVLQAKLSSANA